jgi:DNA-directed RNA polymerase subunit RPC12/RpoP
MRFYCDNCGQRFSDDRDCSGDACNRCEDGMIYRDEEDE